MRLIILLLSVFILNSCALLVAKETVKVVDIVLEGEVNPDKKRTGQYTTVVSAPPVRMCS